MEARGAAGGPTVGAAESVERGRGPRRGGCLGRVLLQPTMSSTSSTRNFDSEDTKVVFTYVAKPVDCKPYQCVYWTVRILYIAEAERGQDRVRAVWRAVLDCTVVYSSVQYSTVLSLH